MPSAEGCVVQDSEGLPADFRDIEGPDLPKLVERLKEQGDLSDDEQSLRRFHGSRG